MKDITLSTEFQKYRFADYLRATALAPLACILGVLLVDLLFLTLTDSIIPSGPDRFATFRGWASLLVFFSLPSTYISTAIFGALGVDIANWTRIRLTIPIGAVAGVVGGILTGLVWGLILSQGQAGIRAFFSGLGLLILLDASFCGLFVGAAYAALVNRSAQHRSPD